MRNFVGLIILRFRVFWTGVSPIGILNLIFIPNYHLAFSFLKQFIVKQIEYLKPTKNNRLNTPWNHPTSLSLPPAFGGSCSTDRVPSVKISGLIRHKLLPFNYWFFGLWLLTVLLLLARLRFGCWYWLHHPICFAGVNCQYLTVIMQGNCCNVSVRARNGVNLAFCRSSSYFAAYHYSLVLHCMQVVYCRQI